MNLIKGIFYLATIFTLCACKEMNHSELDVQKWVLLQDVNSKTKKHVIANYKFDTNNCPTRLTFYSRSGSNMTDSILFDYSTDRKQVKVSNFRPFTKENQKENYERVVDLVFRKSETNGMYYIVSNRSSYDTSYYHRWLNSPKRISYYNDTLNLLQEYIANIENIVSISKDLNVTPVYTKGNEDKFYYPVRFIPSILLEYGVAFDEELHSMSYSLKDKLLIRDEFNFDKHDVKRTYIYKEGLIERVDIKVFDKLSQSESEFSEFFVYTKKVKNSY